MPVGQRFTCANKDHKEVVASQEGKKKERRCKNCNQVGHYAPRCPNI